MATKKEITFQFDASGNVHISDGSINYTCKIEEFVQKNKGYAISCVRTAVKGKPGTYLHGRDVFTGEKGEGFGKEARFPHLSKEDRAEANEIYRKTVESCRDMFESGFEYSALLKVAKTMFSKLDEKSLKIALAEFEAVDWENRKKKVSRKEKVESGLPEGIAEAIELLGLEEDDENIVESALQIIEDAKDDEDAVDSIDEMMSALEKIKGYYSN